MTGEGAGAIAAELQSMTRCPDWEVRARAGRLLAPQAGQPGVDVLLRSLLLDEQNTAVTLETAEALLERAGRAGMELVAWAVAGADEQTKSWLIAAVHGVCAQDAEDLAAALRLCRDLSAAEDPRVRTGAQELGRLLRDGGW